MARVYRVCARPQAPQHRRWLRCPRHAGRMRLRRAWRRVSAGSPDPARSPAIGPGPPAGAAPAAATTHACTLRLRLGQAAGAEAASAGAAWAGSRADSA